MREPSSWTECELWWPFDLLHLRGVSLMLSLAPSLVPVLGFTGSAASFTHHRVSSWIFVFLDEIDTFSIHTYTNELFLCKHFYCSAHQIEGKHIAIFLPMTDLRIVCRRMNGLSVMVICVIRSAFFEKRTPRFWWERFFMHDKFNYFIKFKSWF